MCVESFLESSLLRSSVKCYEYGPFKGGNQMLRLIIILFPKL